MICMIFGTLLSALQVIIKDYSASDLQPFDALRIHIFLDNYSFLRPDTVEVSIRHQLGFFEGNGSICNFQRQKTSISVVCTMDKKHMISILGFKYSFYCMLE